MLTLLDPAVHAAYLAVSSLAAALFPISGGASTALAIVVFTVAIKFCLSPLSLRTARAERVRTALAPQLAALQKRFAKDPARLAAEVRALYRREGVRPLAGFLPALLQMPVMSVVYRLFVMDTVAGQPNTLLVATVLGAPLGSSWPTVIVTFGVLSWPALAMAVLVVLLIGVATVASRQLRSGVTGDGITGTVVRLMPFSAVVFAAFVPIATAVYLLTSTACTVAERAALTRYLG